MIKWSSNYDLEFYTDSAGGSSKGCAVIFARICVFMQWPAAWKNTPVLRDITYLECPIENKSEQCHDSFGFCGFVIKNKYYSFIVAKKYNFFIF
jgi:hypothetical protein